MFFLCILLLGCSGCKSQSVETEEVETEDGVEIGIIFDTFVIERWQKDRDIFVATVQELGGTVDVQNANGDIQNQIEQMDYFIDKKVDVIVVVPIESKALSPYVSKAKKQGIKVISYDRIVADSNTDLYISFDNEQVGRLMAESLGEVLGKDDKVLMICGSEDDMNVFSAQKGFEKAAREQKLKILDIYYAQGWKAEAAGDYIEKNLELVKEADAIMCGNDNLAGKVIQKLTEYQLADEIYVAGQDADLDACQRIMEGSQYMTVYKSIDTLAKEAAKAAVQLAEGKKVDTEFTMSDGSYTIPFLKLESVAVLENNMEEVIINGGFHMREDVYLNRPELLGEIE